MKIFLFILLSILCVNTLRCQEDITRDGAKVYTGEQKDASLVPVEEKHNVISQPELSPGPVPEPGLTVRKKISLEVRNLDIIQVLKIIAQRSRLNIVVGRDVRGHVTVFLKDMDVFDALRVITSMNNLAYVMEDEKTVKVYTDAEYEKLYGRKFADVVLTKVVKMKSANAEKVAKLLEGVKSRVGRIIIDQNTNSLILTDEPETLQKLESMIAELDVKEKGVFIEAKIIQVILNRQFQTGINWQKIFSGLDWGIQELKDAPGSIKGNFGVVPADIIGTTEFQIGTIEKNDFTALFRMLSIVGKTNILSSPRLLVMNGKEARILVGTREAYITTTVTTPGTGATTTSESVSFVDVGVKLFVTPFITEDGYISMKIKPEVSSVHREIKTAQGNTIPVIRTSEQETTILVEDNTTAILGGLMEDTNIKTDYKIPLLGDIPLIGRLFKGSFSTKAKTELVVFITPRIVVGGITAEEMEKLEKQTK